MTISRQEEIITALWTIAAILAFGFNFNAAGWCFTIKAATDFICLIYSSIKELNEKSKRKPLKT